MNHFQRRRGELCCEKVPLSELAAEVGTPAYVYSTRPCSGTRACSGPRFGVSTSSLASR